MQREENSYIFLYNLTEKSKKDQAEKQQMVNQKNVGRESQNKTIEETRQAEQVQKQPEQSLRQNS